MVRGTFNISTDTEFRFHLLQSSAHSVVSLIHNEDKSVPVVLAYLLHDNIQHFWLNWYAVTCKGTQQVCNLVLRAGKEGCVAGECEWKRDNSCPTLFNCHTVLDNVRLHKTALHCKSIHEYDWWSLFLSENDIYLFILFLCGVEKCTKCCPHSGHGLWWNHCSQSWTWHTNLIQVVWSGIILQLAFRFVILKEKFYSVSLLLLSVCGFDDCMTSSFGDIIWSLVLLCSK